MKYIQELSQNEKYPNLFRIMQLIKLIKLRLKSNLSRQNHLNHFESYKKKYESCKKKNYYDKIDLS